MVDVEPAFLGRPMVGGNCGFLEAVDNRGITFHSNLGVYWVG